MLKPFVRVAVPAVQLLGQALARSRAHAQAPPPAGAPGQTPPGAPGAPPGGPPAATMPPPLAADTAAHVRDSLADVVLKKIAGRENAPAESVFKNIKVMKGVPAGRLVRIMNFGFGRSLGVGCAHCHTVGEWDKEDKKQKQITRDMSAMVRVINDTLLTRIQNLESKKPIVNCTTCHRGQVKPALDMGR